MENNMPQKESIADALKKYKEQINSAKEQSSDENGVVASSIPKPSPAPMMSKEELEGSLMKETDPDLMTSYEIVELPSKGLFYPNKLSEVAVEYMTSKDEDLLTTPSLIDNGTVIDVLLKRKIKTKGVDPEKLLLGDRSAILIFLRSSSYGHEYSVMVTDPRTGNQFKDNVDLTKLEYKEIKVLPDENGYFDVFIPMRKKNVKFRLLTTGEDNIIYKKAESIQQAYGEEVNHYNTMKLKAQIVSIEGITDRNYIDKFVEAMPALDSLTIRKKIQEVSPDVDLEYEFTAKDGFKFKSNLVLGLDFFFPNI